MIDNAIPFSTMFDLVFGIITLALVLSNAAAIGTLVNGFATALSTGVKAVQK